MALASRLGRSRSSWFAGRGALAVAAPWSSGRQLDEGRDCHMCLGTTRACLLQSPGRSGTHVRDPSEEMENLRLTFQCFCHKTVIKMR